MLLSRKKDEYKVGPTNYGDVEPEPSDLDMAVSDMTLLNLFDEVRTITSSCRNGSSVPDFAKDEYDDVELCSMDEDILMICNCNLQ